MLQVQVALSDEQLEVLKNATAVIVNAQDVFPRKKRRLKNEEGPWLTRFKVATENMNRTCLSVCERELEYWEAKVDDYRRTVAEGEVGGQDSDSSQIEKECVSNESEAVQSDSIELLGGDSDSSITTISHET